MRDRCTIDRIDRIPHNQVVEGGVGTTGIHRVVVVAVAVAEVGKHHTVDFDS